VGRVPDPIFSDPRLARIYDPLDPDRGDLDVYAAMVDEFGSRRVLDVGCGTGSLACLLARRGVEITGVDPARAAQGKPGAEGVRWILGDATTLPPLQVDLAVMTGNVAQIFLTDEDWAATLAGIRATLRPAGVLVFETRDPSRRAWEEWDRARTHAVTDVPGVGVVESWCDVLEVAGSLVTFRHTYVFASDGAVLTSDSTLRFRSREEVERSLRRAGFGCREVRDAPDRPGRELVFVADKFKGTRQLPPL
jgi:SAM-dependent methyltransferase